MDFEVKVYVQPKEGVLDPEGITIKDKLVNGLGYDQILNFKSGKVYTLNISAENKQAAEELVVKAVHDPLIRPQMVRLQLDRFWLVSRELEDL